ncbi:MAG: disulfide bond formation protein DsbC [Acidobacteria bacterium]|nr:disulfide bond formation protein DsbC [Acidobacteriota bacterium]
MSKALCISVMLASSVLAGSEDLTPAKASVTFEPPQIASVGRGRPGTVELQFRVARGFHINSNQPKQEFLKKTELRLDPPGDIVIAKITYPDGQDQSFPFAPEEKLNVYSGDFRIDVVVRPQKSVPPTKYAVHGFLKYQACDNSACYPPKQLPVTFEVNVTKDRPQPGGANPGERPHPHS